MTEVVGEAVVEIVTDDSKVGPGARTAGQKAGQETKKGFGSAVKGIGGLIGGAIAGAAVIGTIKAAFGEAADAQKVAATTAATIKATGGAANVTAKQVEDLSGALSEKTAVDDEAVQSGANLLLTFKNVRNEAGKSNDIFNQATEAALNLSAAGFGSVESASVMLGKALNDPTKGITALGRAGVTFTEEQKNQVKAMQKNGDLLGAQKIILKEVEGQVGGVAEAQKTAGKEAQVAWGNVLETLGTALLPVLNALAIVFTSVLAPAITALIVGVTNIGSVVSAAVDFFNEWKIVIGLVAGAFLLMLAPIILANVQMLILIATMTVYNAVSKAVAAATRLWAIAQQLLNASLLANPIGLVVIALIALAAIFLVLWKRSETFRRIVTGAFNAVKNAAQAVWNWIRNNWKTLLAVLTGPFGIAVLLIARNWDKIKAGARAAVDWVKARFQDLVGFVRGIPGKIGNVAGQFLQAGKNIGGKVLDGIKAGLTAAGGMVADVANSLRTAINNMLGLPRTIGKGPLKFTIGAFQQGGFVPSSGLALVGEGGRELVGLPGGSRVFNNRDTERILAGLGTGATINVHLPTGDPQAAALAVANRLATL